MYMYIATQKSVTLSRMCLMCVARYCCTWSVRLKCVDEQYMHMYIEPRRDLPTVLRLRFIYIAREYTRRNLYVYIYIYSHTEVYQLCLVCV